MKNYLVRYAEFKGGLLKSFEIKGLCAYDARCNFRALWPDFYISSVKPVKVS